MQNTQATITISHRLAEELDRAAKQAGKDQETFLHELIHQLTHDRADRTGHWNEAIAVQDAIKASARAGGIVEFIRRMRDTRYGR
ncbi:hypothetical protein HYW17_01220 [Candidatus Uhrbacteria bacterium]|nr:hypothetical protein [Candidatus Uhrbacteria bacterium]